MNETSPSPRPRPPFWLLWVFPALIVGAFLSLLVPQPVVGVIRLNDAIYDYTAHDLITQIQYAADHPEIRAVVLVLNSPGGTVTDTESVYLELARLRKQKPVVAVVEGMAASGAYYLSVGSDYVLAKPSSIIGNVGVIGVLPDAPYVQESQISTGPYKLTGSTSDYALREIDMLKQGFIQAVLLGRGERLKLTRDEVLTGQIWNGSDALRAGLIDALGTQSDALVKAAELGKVRAYRVQELAQVTAEMTPQAAVGFFQKDKEGVQTSNPASSGIYFLYVPPAVQQ